ncbi:hypothetical protein FOA52_015089 [Chlamydomonas sp. UWO 241]|nr:hypothetical protein FOA52_015089 [Chlamydomonas sp. UWO 241]
MHTVMRPDGGGAPMQPLGTLLPRQSIITAATGGQEDRAVAGKKSSKFEGVTWNKARGAWRAQLCGSGSVHPVGFYDTEEDAARAYDCAAVKMHGSECNFPDEVINEAPVSRGAERKERKTSRFIGVCRHSFGWRAQLWDPTTKRKLTVRTCASEVEAAWAHDVAAVKQDPDVNDKKLNFPAQARASPSGEAPQWLLEGKPDPEQPQEEVHGE